jgi:probable rRNA maturation factor
MDLDKQDPDIRILITQEFEGIQVRLLKLKKLTRTICKNCGGFQISKTDYEISVAIVDDKKIRKLNNRFLNRKSNTDCLSFDLSDEQAEARTSKSRLRTLELIVNGQKAVKQADLRGHTAEAELALYITHGLLHQFGYDDTTEGRAAKMHRKEDEILQQFGYGLVYNKEIKKKITED